MIKIRYGTFETNSSSTHAIAVPKARYKHSDKQSILTFGFGDFGWEFREVNPCDYFYTAIYALYDDDALAEALKTLTDALDEYGYGYVMEEPKQSSWNGTLDVGYIDHDNEVRGFVKKLLADKDKLMAFLLGGRVFTGNDNSEASERCFVERESPTYEEWEYDENTGDYTGTKEVHNPYYMENHDDYEWYYKGN